MAAMITSMAACSSQTTSASASSETSVETTAAEAEAENGTEDTATGAGSGTEGTAAEAESDTSVSDTAAGTEEITAKAATAASGTVQPGPAKNEIETTETSESSEDSSHAITADGEEISVTNTAVTKTGDSDQGDEADFYGDNAAVFATNGAALSLDEMVIETDGTHANAVFSYGEGTTVNI